MWQWFTWNVNVLLAFNCTEKFARYCVCSVHCDIFWVVQTIHTYICVAGIACPLSCSRKRKHFQKLISKLNLHIKTISIWLTFTVQVCKESSKNKEEYKLDHFKWNRIFAFSVIMQMLRLYSCFLRFRFSAKNKLEFPINWAGIFDEIKDTEKCCLTSTW